MIDALNAAAAVASLALAVLLAGAVDLARVDGAPAAVGQEGVSSIDATVVDATGVAVPARGYERIASATTIGDQVLDAILEPSRLVAITAETRRSSRTPWRHEGRATVADLADLETLIALDPELVVVANVAEARRVARLREAGLVVFDIGSMTGVDSLLEATRRLGRLVGEPERADAFAERFRERLARVAPEVDPRPAAVYVGAWGNQLFGGAAGTSYHDVLEAAGLTDAAAAAGYEGWPTYSVEQLVELDPEWLVVPATGSGELCERETLTGLTACREGRVAAIDDALLGDPGFGMLPAAEALHRRVFE